MAVSLDTLISRSVARIGEVHPSLKEYAIELIKRAYSEGIRVQLSSGYRSYEDQANIYGQGRSSYWYKNKNYGRLKDAKGKQLPIISNAEPGESIHNYGLAIDYFLVSADGKKAIWDVTKEWKRVAEIAKGMGFEWGGDWKSFRDYPHLQYDRGLTLTQLAKGSRPAFPKLAGNKEEPPKPTPTPVITLNRAIAIGSIHDYPSAERLAIHLKVPIYPKKAIVGVIAKEIIVVGGPTEGLKAPKITNLSGATKDDTAANVNKYLK